MYRIGFGSDIHRLEAGKKLILGGIEIASNFGAIGHSDADALFHAVTDAILGALALGDIGLHFSDQDPRWKNSDSGIFLAEAIRLMKEKGFEVINADSIVSLEKPKLRPYINAIRENLARSLEIEIEAVSVKAKTGEGVDAVGESRAIRAEAVILLEKITKNETGILQLN
jgi:2-C-methyl-D-erythritol 2,4-cyclodiphosphate synthase